MRLSGTTGGGTGPGDAGPGDTGPGDTGPGRPDAGALAAALRGALGADLVSTDAADLSAHGTDESFHACAPPDVVVRPRCTQDVVRAVKVAGRLGAPVIPFGAGTSLEGHVSAPHGGVCVDMSAHMTKVLRVNVDDMDCHVQAGISRAQLNAELRHTGLFFPVDPGADVATLGGMASTNASGTTTVAFGNMKANVMGLSCVLADGTEMRTGSRARKSSAGYDLTSLLVGSEGTLACLTELHLRLRPQPEAVASAVCAFDSTEGAIDTVLAALQCSVPLARAEFLDEVAMRAVADELDEVPEEEEEKKALELEGLEGLEGEGQRQRQRQRPCLFLEFHGTQRGVRESADAVEALARERGMAGDFSWATQEEDRQRLWRARHRAYWASLRLRPGSRGWPTDVCVPMSRLADCIAETQADVAARGVTAPLFGHVADGNFHLILLRRPDESQEYLQSLADINDRLVARALEMGGTCTGEHGVGLGKRHWLERETGAAAVAAMRSVKAALDPDNRFNPGKAI